MVKKIALYCRVSSDDQKERETIENQIEMLESFIEMKDEYKIYKKYLDDGVSGTIAFENRPGGKELLKDSSSGLFDAILVWKVDRFGRDTLTGLSTVEKLRNYNIEIISITEPFDLNTPTGRYQFINYLNMAELERNNILDRMFIGATRAAKKGQWLGGITPYGYRVKNKYLVVDEEEAKVVKKIYDLYTEDKLSTVDIAIYLNNKGVKSSCGEGKGKRTKNITGMWRSSSVQRILNSTTYYGLHEYGKRASRRKETILREVPAIISKEQWDKAQNQKEANKVFNSRNMKTRVFLLRGLLECKECKNKYYGVNYGERGAYYVCSGKRGEKKKIDGVKCNNINVNAIEAEDIVWDACLDILNNIDEYVNDLVEENNINSELSKYENDVNSFNDALVNKENEKKNILALFRKGIIDENDVEIQLKEIEKEKATLNKQLLDLNNKLEIIKNKDEIIKESYTALDYYKNRLNNLTEADKYEIIHILIEKIIVSPIIVDGKKKSNLEAYFHISNLLTARTRVWLVSLKNTTNETIGIKLKNLRLKNNTSRAALAKILNIDDKTLKNVENNVKTKYVYYYIHLYAKIFNVDKVEYFKLYNMKEFSNKDKLLKIRAYIGAKTWYEVADILDVDISTIMRYKRIDKPINIIDKKLKEIKEQHN